MASIDGLRAEEHGGIRFLTDAGAADDGVLVAFFDRVGGVSMPPYDSLNLAARVGDNPDAVAENRARSLRAVGFPHGALALARQVHGVDVLEVPAGARGVVGEGDVLLVRTPGVVAGLLTADCAPVAIAGSDGVALAHAGWRGLVGGVVERAAAAVGSPRGAWIGPCIHACCYEVGPEVIAAFEAAGLPVAGQDRVDPARAAAVALRRAGVPAVTRSDECTSCNPRYFSYRRDGVTGRQGTFVALTGGNANGPA